MELLVATTNNHKLQELRKILPESFKISGLNAIGFTGDIPETGTTFAANALQKVRFLKEVLGKEGIADDSGLEVAALKGRPGVYSARYAGPGCTSSDNIKKLLTELQGISDRSARFVTVLALILNGHEYTFEGTVNGRITHEISGKHGFGYDPVFIPDGHSLTFAEMPESEKNRISHRAAAAEKLKAFLESLKF